MSTAQAENRIRSIFQNAVSTGAARGIGVLVSLGMVPLMLGYLGSERYGVWVAMSSMIAFLQIADLGIVNALVSLVARRQAAGESRDIPGLMVTAMLMLSMMGGLLVGLFLILEGSADWQALLNYSGAVDGGEVRDAILTFVVMFALGLPLLVVQQVRIGLLQGRLNGLYLVAGQILNLLFVILAIRLQAGISLLVVASTLGGILGGVANLVSIVTALRQPQGIIWRPSSDSGTLLLRSGGLFIVLQACALIAYNVDNLLVANIMGAHRVPEYSIAMRIFSFPGLLFSFFFAGMWPAYADAEERGERAWARRFFWKSTRRSLLAGIVLAGLLLVFSPWVIAVLSHGTVSAEPLLLVGMALWAACLAVGGALSTLFNAMHIVRFQIFITILFTGLNIVASVWLTKRIGISGPIWGSILMISLQYPLMFWYIKRRIFVDEVASCRNQ